MRVALYPLGKKLVISKEFNLTLGNFYFSSFGHEGKKRHNVGGWGGREKVEIMTEHRPWYCDLNYF